MDKGYSVCACACVKSLLPGCSLPTVDELVDKGYSVCVCVCVCLCVCVCVCACMRRV